MLVKKGVFWLLPKGKDNVGLNSMGDERTRGIAEGTRLLLRVIYTYRVGETLASPN